MSQQLTNDTSTIIIRSEESHEEEDYSGLFESDMFQVDENYFRKPRPARIEVFNIENSDFQVKVRLLGMYLFIHWKDLNVFSSSE